MYTISKNPYNDLPKLHFNYRLAELQEDVERATSYLGKFRRTESAAHLQDLIAMTKDESNMFTPIAKEVALSVFDEFKKGVFNAGDCEWKYKTSVVMNKITIPPIVKVKELQDFNVNFQGDDLLIESINFTTNLLDLSLYKIEFQVELSYQVKFAMLYDTDIEVVRNKKIKYTITFDSSNKQNEYVDSLAWGAENIYIPASLEDETDLTSRETIVGVTDLRIISCKAIAINDSQLNIGDIIDVAGELYEMTNDTSLNQLNLKKDAVKIDVLDVNDGVHYYADLYFFNKTSAINTLDEAIKNALQYGVIWKWLMLAFPADAETYLAMYNNAKKEVYSRCIIFNRQHNKVPRIL
jgi:hypothetical protein